MRSCKLRFQDLCRAGNGRNPPPGKTDIYDYGGGSWTIDNNCYASAAVAGTPGTGNSPVIGDPLFVEAADKDFHLQASSPCIDKGIDAGIAADPDGTAIPRGGAPDIGAFEFIDRKGTTLTLTANGGQMEVEKRRREIAPEWR